MTTENGEVRNVEIPLDWQQVLLADGKPFPWHQSPAPYPRDREPLEHPQVYKWVLRDANGKTVYIGEASAFDQRLGKYRNPDSDTTEQRVRQAMDECEQRGGTIELWFLEIAADSFHLNGSLINKYSIGDKNVRLILENLAILEERRNKTTILNVIEDNAYDRKLAALADELVRKHGMDAAIGMIRGLLGPGPVASEDRRDDQE